MSLEQKHGGQCGGAWLVILSQQCSLHITAGSHTDVTSNERLNSTHFGCIDAASDARIRLSLVALVS
jgi:hypothetical protein